MDEELSGLMNDLKILPSAALSAMEGSAMTMSKVKKSLKKLNVCGTCDLPFEDQTDLRNHLEQHPRHNMVAELRNFYKTTKNELETQGEEMTLVSKAQHAVCLYKLGILQRMPPRRRKD